ncbi:MAG: S-layer homology domain-containing protein [bacterium]|nr:S-layer homology domain-containing protein [bacterium]
MKNRLTIALIIIALSIPSASADIVFDASGYLNNSTFADVSLDHENFNAIYYLQNTGVVQGDSGQSTDVKNYRPTDNINRAEFLKMTIEGNNIPVSSTQESCFPDVPAGEWYAPYICTAKNEGWINGYPDGTFKPAQTINEIESIKILGEVTGWEIENRPGAEWYEAYLEPAKDRNIVPQDDISALMTRGDIAELVFRNTQVDTLQISNYDPKYDAALFDLADIPITGPLAPGSLMGPMGPLGDQGISDNDGPFAKGGAELLTPSFFDENYCYFSDQGDFSGDNLDFLKDYTQEDLDKYVEGSYADEYGKMFCYSGIASTDLVYFEDWMREFYNWMCWDLPNTESETYNEIFCWVSEKDFEIPPIPVASGPKVAIEVIDKADFAIMPDWEDVKLLEFNNKSLIDQNIPIDGLDLYNYGTGDAYGLKRLTIKDND